MSLFKPRYSIFFFLLFILIGCGNVSERKSDGNKNSLALNLPENFHIEVYAEAKNARAMTLGEKGTVFVGSRKAGNVYALIDRNNDHKADEVKLIAKDLKQPCGVAFYKGDLYVSAISRILRFDNIEEHLDNPPKPVVIYDKFPTEEHHGWKFIAFGPDGKLYVPVGAPCNICESEDSIFASITRMNPDGSDLEIYAHGVRNSVGFDWHPETGELWFSDNGRDWLGDDLPPCEINYAPEKDMHFGYPYCHGGDIADPEFGEKRSCEEFTKPAQKLQAHVAPLGVMFYTGDMFPPEYKNQLFVAEHGSWNRSTKIGYRVMLLKLENNESQGYEPFADGWLDEGKVSGRPVDLLQLPDGSVLVSDDYGDKVYRITFKNE